MAQETPPLPGTETGDSLNLAFQVAGSTTTRDTGAMTSPLDFSVQPGPHGPFYQPIMPSMTPLPSPGVTTTFPYHVAHQNGIEPAESDVAAGQISQPVERSGNHDDPEVDTTCENAQQGAEIPKEAEIIGVDVAIAEPQDETSSDNLSDAGMEDGPESQMSPEAEDDIDRLDKYAFNYTGQAYDHRVPQHFTGGTKLYAKKVTQGTTILEHIRSAKDQDEINMCPELVPHEVEMKRNTKAVECIWVGMLPNPQSSPKHATPVSAKQGSQADAASPAAQDGGDNAIAQAQIDGTSTSAKKIRKKPKKALSIIDLPNDELDIIPHNPVAFRVVARKQTRTVKTWHLYALTTSGRDSKLCQGWKVYSDEVFFFKAFRDDTIAGILKRRHASDDKIKAVTFPGNDPPPSVPQSSSPSKHSASLVSTPATPPPSGLPSPKPSGRKGKPNHTVRKATGKQACKVGDVLDQDYDDAGSPAGSVEDGDESDAGKPSGHESKERGTARLEADPSELVGTVYDFDDEDAYPEHAVPANSESFENLVSGMISDLSVVDPASEKRGEKRKRVAFEPACDAPARLRRKTGGSSRSDAGTRGGLGREGSASYVVQQHTDHLVRKLISMIEKLAANQDVAGLRQCVTMVDSIEKRGLPGPESALAPYLGTSSRKDADPRACCGKLREILVGPPPLFSLSLSSSFWFIEEQRLIFVGPLPQYGGRRRGQLCPGQYGLRAPAHRSVHRHRPH